MIPIFPGFSPLAMPVRTVIYRCRPLSPLSFHKLPGLTLRGAFGYALAKTACREHREGKPPCPGNKNGNPLCNRPEECYYPILFKPYSNRLKKSFASPVIFKTAHLSERMIDGPFDLPVVLIGRKACDALGILSAAVQEIGRAGVNAGWQTGEFEVEELISGKIASVLDMMEKGENIPGNGLIEFVSPFCFEDKASGKGPLASSTCLPLISMIGNFAGWLARWAVYDGDGLMNLEKRQIEDRVDRWMDAVKGACAKTHVVRTALLPFDFGERTSGTNHHVFRIQGFTGHAVIRGDLSGAWPWLKAMEICHGGGKRPQGLGEIRLWPGN